jgi:sec-independent protein translocase protein TatB
MFGIDSGELLIIAVVALVVIGPKDLPRVMRTVGNFVGRARGMAKHFRSGLDAMMREAELEEMEKKWRSENDRIMREYPLAGAPAPDVESDWGKAEPSASGEVGRPKPVAPPRPAGGPDSLQSVRGSPKAPPPAGEIP